MGDNINNNYRNVDPTYYNQTGQEWPGYTPSAQQDPNYRPDTMYMGQQEHYGYPPYDPNYVNYQMVPSEPMNMGYQNYPVDQHQMSYQVPPPDQMVYQYHPSDSGNPGNPGNMSYPVYSREPPMMNYYNQQRNVMAPNYVKKEAMDMNQNMGNTNVNSPNVGYYQNIMYYNGHPGMKKDNIQDKRNDTQSDKNNDFFVSNNLSQPSLTFREVANAMLSMSSGKRSGQSRSRGSGGKSRGGMKSAAKISKLFQEQMEPNQFTTEQEANKTSKSSDSVQPSKTPASTSSQKTTEQSTSTTSPPTKPTITRRKCNQISDIECFNDPNFTYIPVSKLSHIDLNKYRNRGLQQLSQYNQYLQQGQLGQSAKSTSKTKQKTIQNNFNQNNKDETISQNVSMAVIRNVKEWTPIKKINPNMLTPSARFFPPTPKALSIIKNEQSTHKMNVVEEINVENDLIRNLKKNSISAASSLMESFQQSFSNKRKRIKNCLVEDCRHVIGEHPKIDIQYSSVEVNGDKKYFLNEILSTLLPYHLFYYENIYRTEVQRYDYSHLSGQVDQLRERLSHLTNNQESILLQSVYPCVKESLVTCNDCLVESSQESSRMY